MASRRFYQIGAVARDLIRSLVFFRRRKSKLDLILERLHHMSVQIDALIAAVNAEDTVIDSAITLLNGLSAEIAGLSPDSAAIAKLAAEVKAKTDALAAAVAANTPATTPTPTPAPSTPPSTPAA